MGTRDALDGEIEAYERMHTQLCRSHFGQYVAVHNGQLIDSDFDFEPLFLRVQAKLGDGPFLVRRVTSTVTPEIRAPRSYAWPSPLAQRLRAYEQQYGMVSEDFSRRFQTGELGDDIDFVEWSIFWDMYQTESGRLAE